MSNRTFSILAITYNKMHPFVVEIKKQKILPLYSHQDTEVLIQVISACYHEGIRFFELTNRTANASDVFKSLKSHCISHFPDLKLGVGTIKNVRDAELFCSLGADFLVSPIVSIDLISYTKSNSVFWIPGCATPSEVGLAETNEIELVKIFPANLIGGLGFIKTMKEIFPMMQFLATGGINGDKEEINSWLMAGATAVGLGSSLFGKELPDFDKIASILKANK